ncbi:MAG: hypothetical protein ACYCZN_01140 [Candidatus Dormibacteria bacterium]
MFTGRQSEATLHRPGRVTDAFYHVLYESAHMHRRDRLAAARQAEENQWRVRLAAWEEVVVSAYCHTNSDLQG